MRPQIPEALEKRIEEITERGGYSTESEFVRDAVRRRVEELESYTSNRAIQRWLENESRIDVITEDSFPSMLFDPNTGQKTTIEKGSWVVLTRVSNIPVWVHGGQRRDSISIQCSLNRDADVDVDTSFLFNGPGAVVGFSGDGKPTQELSSSSGVGLSRSISRPSINESVLVNTVLGMGGTIQMAIKETPSFEELIHPWESSDT